MAFPRKSCRTPVRTARRGVTFLQAQNTNFASLVSDDFWLGKLAYLADIFNLLNGLNLSLQGRDTNT